MKEFHREKQTKNHNGFRKEDQEELEFQAVNSGVGFSSALVDTGFSYYEKKEENLSQPDIFDQLSQSPDFYDELKNRLEEPLLSSVNEKGDYKNNFTPQKQTSTEKVKPSFKSSLETYSEIHSPLNSFCLPSFEVLKVDFMFTFGLFMLGGVLTSLVFGIYQVPPLFLTLFLYGVFYQLYVACMRSFIGYTLGEERCNIGWNQRSSLRFIARSLLFILTGFIVIPLFSMIFKKDLFEDLTGLKLRYNI